MSNSTTLNTKPQKHQNVRVRDAKQDANCRNFFEKPLHKTETSLHTSCRQPRQEPIYFFRRKSTLPAHKTENTSVTFICHSRWPKSLTVNIQDVFKRQMTVTDVKSLLAEWRLAESSGTPVKTGYLSVSAFRHSANGTNPISQTVKPNRIAMHWVTAICHHFLFGRLADSFQTLHLCCPLRR